MNSLTDPSKYHTRADQRLWTEKRNCRLCGAEFIANRGEGKTYRKRNGRHEHRIVAEQKLGRPLKPGEIVHHVDGNKRNNDPENLQVMTQSEHINVHRVRFPRIVRPCSIPGCDRPYSAKGLCQHHYLKRYREERQRAAH